MYALRWARGCIVQCVFAKVQPFLPEDYRDIFPRRTPESVGLHRNTLVNKYVKVHAMKAQNPLFHCCFMLAECFDKFRWSENAFQIIQKRAFSSQFKHRETFRMCKKWIGHRKNSCSVGKSSSWYFSCQLSTLLASWVQVDSPVQVDNLTLHDSGEMADHLRRVSSSHG